MYVRALPYYHSIVMFLNVSTLNNYKNSQSSKKWRHFRQLIEIWIVPTNFNLGSFHSKCDKDVHKIVEAKMDCYLDDIWLKILTSSNEHFKWIVQCRSMTCFPEKGFVFRCAHDNSIIPLLLTHWEHIRGNKIGFFSLIIDEY